MKTITNKRTLKMVQLALFTAIILLMAFTPLGYIKTPGLEITLLVVPVAVGAIILGPTAGAILGGVFGVTSFIQAFGGPLGAALLGISVIGTFVLCVVTRILMGWLTGLIFKAMNRWDRTKLISHATANLAGALLNTVLFMSTFVLLFYNTDYVQGIVTALGATNPIHFILLFVTVNGLIEALICFVVGTAVSKAIDVFTKKSGTQIG
ncbi:MAG: putative rane protein [Herbinix sp.]|nr:putative rane protein [Herbinix sp.]